MNSIWTVMIVVGLLTFLTRLSFILLLERWKPPQVVRSALRYVPVAALSAIIVPELLVVNDTLDFSLGNARLIAGVVAALVAWRTKNALWTIAAGMTTFLILKNFVL